MIISTANIEGDRIGGKSIGCGRNEWLSYNSSRVDNDPRMALEL
jgi:hypothetical protein